VSRTVDVRSFDQPFAMLCDAPTEYRKYPDIMKYLSAGSHNVRRNVCARSGSWRIRDGSETANKNAGMPRAMTNWTSRDFAFDFLIFSGKKHLAG